MKNLLNKLKDGPYAVVKRYPKSTALIGILLIYGWFTTLAIPWNKQKFDVHHLEFSFAMLTEAIIILVTVFVIKIFVEKREEEHRIPLYQSVSMDAFHVYDEIYELIFSIMRDVCIS